MKPRYWIVCPDFVSGPHGSREVAERQLQHIEALGACHYDHEVREAATKPLPTGWWASAYYSDRD